MRRGKFDSRAPRSPESPWLKAPTKKRNAIVSGAMKKAASSFGGWKRIATSGIRICLTSQKAASSANPMRWCRKSSQPIAAVAPRTLGLLDEELAQRAIELRERRAHDDATVADHRHVVGDFLHFVEKVRREEHGAPLVGDRS